MTSFFAVCDDERPDRGSYVVPVFVIGIVIATTLATGPVGIVDLTKSEPSVLGSTGTVTVSNATLPDIGQITHNPSFDGRRSVSFPPATATVSNVSGHPRLVYRVVVRPLGRQIGSTRWLEPGDAGVVTIDLDSFYVDEGRTIDDPVPATATLLVRNGTSERVVATSDVHLRVTG